MSDDRTPDEIIACIERRCGHAACGWATDSETLAAELKRERVEHAKLKASLRYAGICVWWPDLEAAARLNFSQSWRGSCGYMNSHPNETCLNCGRVVVLTQDYLSLKTGIPLLACNLSTWLERLGKVQDLWLKWGHQDYTLTRRVVDSTIDDARIIKKLVEK